MMTRIFIILLFLAILGAGVTDALMVRDSKMFTDDFSADTILYETESAEKSQNKNWWLNSGGIFFARDGVGKTISGDLPLNSPMRITYNIWNSKDSNQGKNPQNLFRLITKEDHQNFSEEFYFKIKKINSSESDNKNSSNGVFMFIRREDDENLYYAGIRVDGRAVIKKKVNGAYKTLALEQLYFSKERSEKEADKELIPLDSWLGLRAIVENKANNRVSIKLYHDTGKTGHWNLAAEALDELKDDESKLLNSGGGGIRTDFADVEFDDFMILDINA